MAEYKVISILWPQIHGTRFLRLQIQVPVSLSEELFLGVSYANSWRGLFLLSFPAPHQDHTDVLPKATDADGTKVTSFPSAFTGVKVRCVPQRVKSWSFLFFLEAHLPFNHLTPQTYLQMFSYKKAIYWCSHHCSSCLRLLLNCTFWFVRTGVRAETLHLSRKLLGMLRLLVQRPHFEQETRIVLSTKSY